MTIDIIGLYPVRRDVHLIECWIKGNPDERVLFDEFAQSQPGVNASGWQVAYDEHLLNPSGTDGMDIYDSQGIAIEMDLRFAFFMHYLDVARPILSPIGLLTLPAETPRPDRLSFMEYHEPD